MPGITKTYSVDAIVREQPQAFQVEVLLPDKYGHNHRVLVSVTRDVSGKPMSTRRDPDYPSLYGCIDIQEV